MPSYVGWYPRRRGILEHLEHGTISLLDAAVHDFLCLIADHQTGVAWVSADKIHALAGAGISRKAVQRSLQKLESIGWIRRFQVPGRRGNYPTLIGRYFVKDSSLKWLSVNLERTTDWHDVQFDPVTDPSFIGHQIGNRGDGDDGSEASCVQEVRIESKEARPTEGVRRTTAVRRTSPVGRVLDEGKQKKKLRDGLIRKIEKTGESLKAFFDSSEREDGKRYPEWWDTTLEACRFVRYRINEDDPTVTMSFVGALSNQFERHEDVIRNGEMLPGILATKVIDELIREKQMFPPTFVEHRDRLREQERATCSQ